MSSYCVVPCDNCVGGVANKAICPMCNGTCEVKTTPVEDVSVVAEAVVAPEVTPAPVVETPVEAPAEQVVAPAEAQ